MHHLVGQWEIAQLLGLSRQRVSQLARERNFPLPAADLHGMQVWCTDDIVEWAEKTGRKIVADDADASATIEDEGS